MKARIFANGDLVRYRPGDGTYGYEDGLEDDGRLPATVIGRTATRVRVRITFRIGPRAGFTVDRAVDAESLKLQGDAAATPPPPSVYLETEDLRGTWRPRDPERHGEAVITVSRSPHGRNKAVVFLKTGKVWVLPREKFVELFERIP